MAERQLVVRIIGDDRSLNQAFTRSERRTRQFEGRTAATANNLTRAFAAVGVSLGTAAVFTGIERSISAASDLNEQVSKSRQVFGDASRSIEDWSETTAKGFGISQREALAATGTFGNLFRVIEIAPQQAGAMSRALVQLASDLASFNNASPEDVLVAIRSGLIGEAEPLRRYGVLLSEARVQQEALSATGKTNVKALTDQEKALARYNIILSDTVSAQGDFTRTSGGLANQQRILRASVDDLSASVGGVLVPALTDLARTANLAAAGLTKIGDTKVPGGSQVSEIFGWVSGWKELNFLLDQISPKLDNVSKFSLAGAIKAPLELADALEKAFASSQAKQRRKLGRDRDDFGEFVKGMGLKLDKAGLTASLDDDIAVLRELERAIKRRIAVEGQTFVLVQQLTNVRQQIMDLAATQAQDQAQRTRDSTEKIIAARKDEEEQIRKLAEQQRDRRRGQQFEALGLTAEGQEKTPGAGALLRRARSLQDQVKGTALDTPKTQQQLARIVGVLKKNFRTVGKEVRSAILDMLNQISGAFDQGGEQKSGPLTKSSGLNTKKILAGLGLSDEEINELRGRLSSVNSAGRQLAAVGPPAGGRRIREAGLGNNPIFVESHTTINLDGQVVAKVVTKNQQKTRRRNPQQKRGPNRNR